jgi:hypothetical protein
VNFGRSQEIKNLDLAKLYILNTKVKTSGNMNESLLQEIYSEIKKIREKLGPA